MHQTSTSNISKKIVVLLSGYIREGVADKITSMDYDYKKRVVTSKVENWVKIINYIGEQRENGSLVALFANFTEETLFKTSTLEYEAYWPHLLNEIRQSQSLVFIYEDNLNGVYTRVNDAKQHLASVQTISPYQQSNFHDIINPSKSYDAEIRASFNKVEELSKAAEKVDRLLGFIYESGVSIVPYKRNLDITLRIQDFLDEIEGGIFLRLYVPNGRFQAEQFESILKLFENYLQNVEGKSIFIDSRKTDYGIIYIFKDKSTSTDTEELDNSIARFESFMELSQNSPSQAEALLLSRGVSSLDAISTISRFTKQYQRIKLDLSTKMKINYYDLDSSLKVNYLI